MPLLGGQTGCAQGNPRLPPRLLQLKERGIAVVKDAARIYCGPNWRVRPTGSHTQGTATADSDVDVLVEWTGSGPAVSRGQRQETALHVQALLQRMYQPEGARVFLYPMTKSCKFVLEWPDGDTQRLDMTVEYTRFAPAVSKGYEPKFASCPETAEAAICFKKFLREGDSLPDWPGYAVEALALAAAHLCPGPRSADTVFLCMLGLLRRGALQVPSQATAWDQLRTITRPHLPKEDCAMPPNGDLLAVGQKAIRYLRKHKLITNPQDRPYPCSHCGRSFDSPQALQQHMDAAHPAHTSTYAAQAAQPAVVNAMLGLMAATYISPNQRTTSVPVASSSTTTPRTSSTGPQVHCVMCGHKYDSAEQLWNHMRLTHQRFMCRCGGCSKSFTSQDALAAHVQEKHRS